MKVREFVETLAAMQKAIPDIDMADVCDEGSGLEIVSISYNAEHMRLDLVR